MTARYLQRYIHESKADAYTFDCSKKGKYPEGGLMWFWLALGSAVFAALTSILAKVGIEGVGSNLATAIRTMVVVVMS